MRKLSIASLMCGLLVASPVFSQVQNNPTEDRLRPGTTEDETPTSTNQVRQRGNVERQNRGTNVDRQNRNADGVNRENSDRSAANQTTQALAAWLMTCNNTEIELAKFASQRATDPEVKQFSEMIQQDHQKLQTKLEEFARTSRQNSDSSNSTNAQRNEASTSNVDPVEESPGLDLEIEGLDLEIQTAGNERPNRDQRDSDSTRDRRQESDRAITHRTNRFPTDGSRTRNQMGRQNLLEQVGEQAANNSLEMTKSLLETKQGQNFDMGYIGHQMVAHIQMIGTMKAMQSHASGEFAQVLEEGIQKTEKHLEQAKEISRKISDKENQYQGQRYQEAR